MIEAVFKCAANLISTAGGGPDLYGDCIALGPDATLAEAAASAGALAAMAPGPFRALRPLPGLRQAKKIIAKNGTEITGLTFHGIHRAIGDTAKRAGVKPQAVLDALKNPKKIVEGIDSQGRPFQTFYGTNARVTVNPKTGQIVSMNPLSGAGAH